MKKINPGYFRNLIFGAEDSLVSTVGVLFGVATASPNRSLILLTGLVVIVVEALSMGAGAFLSEKSTHEMDSSTKHSDKPYIGGTIMFFSYFLTGFIPLFPYLIFDIETGKLVSAAIALVALFLLGFLPQKRLKAGIRMAVVAGLAILAGYLIANLFESVVI